MENIGQIRGAVLEVAVAHLMKMVGYRLADAREIGTRNGKSGLEVRGRGCWHQIDTLACLDATPAFMYPLRLLVEAKCNMQRVGVPVVRNAVGVIKDISENYFTIDRENGEDALKFQRFNYHAAVFSASGFSKVAQQYAIAHQVFLIDYFGVSVMKPVIGAIQDIKQDDFQENEQNDIGRIRQWLEAALANGARGVGQNLSELAEEKLGKVENALMGIRGSYFGMLQGRWPLHLVARRPLPQALFTDRDTIQCRVYGYESNKWSFSPIGLAVGDPKYFRLEFKLPDQIASIVAGLRGDPILIADIKQEYFSYMVVSGQIGSIRRTIRLELDSDWIREYKERMERRAKR